MGFDDYSGVGKTPFARDVEGFTPKKRRREEPTINGPRKPWEPQVGQPVQDNLNKDIKASGGDGLAALAASVATGASNA